MDSFILGEDIEVVCLKATSFPDGIRSAHENLHRELPFNENRRYFGISRRDENGVVEYKAAAELLLTDRVPRLQKFTIKGGSYNTYYINNYREKIGAIADCFKLLLGQDEIDPDGYCIEWYIGQNDVKCMVRCNDKNYPVDNELRIH